MNNTNPATNWEKQSKYLALALFVLVAIFFAFTFNIETFRAFLQRYEKFGLITCFFTYILLGVTPMPSEPVTFLVLAWKGPLYAILLATLGNTASAILEFYIGGSIGDLTDFEKKKEKLPFHLGQLPMDSPLFLILGRMLPGFGTKFVSIVGGIYRVSMFTYLWTTLVANLTGAIVVVLGGYGLSRLFQ